MALPGGEELRTLRDGVRAGCSGDPAPPREGPRSEAKVIQDPVIAVLVIVEVASILGLVAHGLARQRVYGEYQAPTFVQPVADSREAVPLLGRPGNGVGSALPLKFCHACGAQIDPRAEICPKCGVRQPGVSVGSGKDRVAAAALALLLGSFGVHKFYLGKVAQGVLYLIFFWAYIPGLVGWIEGITYLRKSNEAWAQEYGGPVQTPSSAAIGCLWVLALLPLLGILAIVALIFLGGQVNQILSKVGTSI
jgi:Predicted membrane protein